MNNKFFNDFIYFTNKIFSDESFAFVRYGDGEIALMKGDIVGEGTQAYSVDKWSAPNQQTIVGMQLLESLEHAEDNYYYAIPAVSDNKDNCDFLRNRIKTKNITFANLWVNANYKRMKEFYHNLSKDIYVICNQKAHPTNFPFNVVDLIPFPDDCVYYWNSYGEDYINRLLSYVSATDKQTFFVSCGPISEILIHRMYLANPNNQYIDVGSSIDEFVHRSITRPYMIEGNHYSQEISYFEDEL